MTGAEYCRRAREIRDTLSGHVAHLAFDDLQFEVVGSLGAEYAEGNALFEEGVRGWHGSALPYPMPGDARDSVTEARSDKTPQRGLAEGKGAGAPQSAIAIT